MEKVIHQREEPCRLADCVARHGDPAARHSVEIRSTTVSEAGPLVLTVLKRDHSTPIFCPYFHTYYNPRD